MEYHLAMRINKILLHATMWINHINIMFRKTKQTHMSIYIKFKSRKNIFIVTKVSLVIIFGQSNAWEMVQWWEGAGQGFL